MDVHIVEPFTTDCAQDHVRLGMRREAHKKGVICVMLIWRSHPLELAWSAVGWNRDGTKVELACTVIGGYLDQQFS